MGSTAGQKRRGIPLALRDNCAAARGATRGGACRTISPIPPFHPFYNKAVPIGKADPAAAKALLAEAGHADGLTVPLWYLRLLPTSGYGTLDQGAVSYVAHLVLPVATLAIGLLAHITRLTRSSMLEALDTAYVKAARARGLPEWAVVTRHALRNALLPTITVLAQDVGFLIGGIVAVETIFAYPGVGRLLVYALERHDLPLMEAAILVLTAVQCLANLAADLLYTFFNPQIRYGRAVA
jgi:ABC-type microcin C transport system permease subunit YejB